VLKEPREDNKIISDMAKEITVWLTVEKEVGDFSFYIYRTFRTKKTPKKRRII
jgi:hypothetical protein